MRAVRRCLPLAGCGLPAAVLSDAAVAAWVRAHGVTVYAGDEDELDLVTRCEVRAAQVVLRCGGAVEPIRGALAVGVHRFVVSTEHHIEILAGCAQADTLVHVDADGPPMTAAGCLDVIGLHCDVPASGPLDWCAATQRLLSRMALMRTHGAALTRISLTGGPADIWMQGNKPTLRAIAAAVDDAIDDGCARWRLPRPSVTFAPSASG